MRQNLFLFGTEYCKSVRWAERSFIVSLLNGVKWVRKMGSGRVFAVVSGFAVVFFLVLNTGCTTVRRDYRKAHPPQISTILDMQGDWIDLDGAVSSAASATGLAVISTDRWQALVRYEMVTDGGQRGELIVVGKRQDEGQRGIESSAKPTSDQNGIERAEVRIGRFRDADREVEFLKALRRSLGERRKNPHLPIGGE